MKSNEKIVTFKKFLPIRINLRKAGKIVVFTNGCFDIIHAGHVVYLEDAKELGDCLVVGINSDKSIRRIKGTKRPIISENDRALIVSALSAVDYVILFDEDTPKKLIDSIIPDILCKGADWEEKDIVGADTVLRNGGKIVRLPILKGRGTSEIIKKIIDNYGNE